MLKRWRDEHDAPLSSILLQVLVSGAPGAGTDAQAVHAALTHIHAALGGHTNVPVIPNPVLPSENLADRWKPDDFDRFRTLIAEAAALADRAIRADGERQSHELWGELSGGFPPAPMPGNRPTSQRPKTRVEHG